MLNGHLRSLAHLVEMVIAIFWLFQATNSLNIVYITCFEIYIKQNSVYGWFQRTDLL